MSKSEADKWCDQREAMFNSSERKEMIGKSIKVDGKTFKITKWNHYRLDWYEVELKDAGGNRHFQYIKKEDIQLIK